jgi:hypothetical protein
MVGRPDSASKTSLWTSPSFSPSPALHRAALFDDRVAKILLAMERGHLVADRADRIVAVRLAGDRPAPAGGPEQAGGGVAVAAGVLSAAFRRRRGVAALAERLEPVQLALGVADSHRPVLPGREIVELDLDVPAEQQPLPDDHGVDVAAIRIEDQLFDRADLLPIGGAHLRAKLDLHDDLSQN